MGEALFRSEVGAARAAWLGTIVLTQPRVALVLTGAALALAAALVTFLCVGEYTRKARVQGQTIPEQGVIKPLSPIAGVVIERFVAEGQRVAAGDRLFVISGERTGQSGGLTQAEVARQLRERRKSLHNERRVQGELGRQQEAALRRRAADARAELVQLATELETRQRRAALAAQTVERYHELARTNFLSPLQLQQREEERLDQVSQLQNLQRIRIGLERDLAALEADLAQLPGRTGAALAAIDRAASSIEQELAENEARRGVVLTAPQDGSITGIVAEPGQGVAAGQALLTLLPDTSRLEVHLYAPSRSVGFVDRGQKVLIRYQAYPYQKFGHYEGTVKHVSRSALADGQFRITVELASQSVRAYGGEQPLQAGMQVEADVLLDRRRFIEWLLEPLYSVTGKL
jgi:membrane fusion protein